MGLDTREYEEFKAKRGQWVDCFKGKDRHSIENQVSWMTWRAAAWRVFDEARRHAPTAQDGGVQINGMICELLDTGFVATHAAAVRRLVDTYCLEGKKGVYSLTALIDDMKASAPLMTREHILEAEGFDYEYQRLDPGDLKWTLAEHRHGQIDRLTGVDAGKRGRCDAVDAALFDQLLKRLRGKCANVHRYVDKFIAHSSAPGSRASVDADSIRITVNDLWAAHQVICEVMSFVGVYVLGVPVCPPLATALFDKLEYIERPLSATEDRENLERAWADFDRETDTWWNWCPDEMEGKASDEDLLP